jgi:hypothetical protein
VSDPGIDLSKVQLTHHALKARPATPMVLRGDTPHLPRSRRPAAPGCWSRRRFASRPNTTPSSSSRHLRT